MQSTKYRTSPLQPFGLLVESTDGQGNIAELSNAQLMDWLDEYQLLIFRGFRRMENQEFALFGQRMGEPLQWPFGTVNDLKVNPEAENYIFTNNAVPMHWDGAFTNRAPHVILFQCIKAPSGDNLGGTTFCHTGKILEDLPESIRSQWAHVNVTYTTEKIAHYGGSVTQAIIDEHPLSGHPVLRYAEPVDDLNPVEVRVNGYEQEQQDQLIADMKALLYDPRYLKVHRWEDGDFVMADNHSLLHGREAFAKSGERHIQRVNVIHRPEKMNWRRWLRNNLIIRRKEFFAAEIPIFMLAVLMSLGTWQDLLQWHFWMGLGAIILLFNLGDMINCLEDYRLDSVYKGHLSNAIYELGEKNVKRQIVGSGVLALIITILLGWWTGRYWIIPLTIAGIVLGLQYSMRPLRLKSAGWWQPLCLWAIIFFGPMIYTSIVTSGYPSLNLILFFSAFGIHQMGIIMLNTAEDYPEDMEDGLTTFTIKAGLHRSVKIAWWLVFGAGMLMQYTMLNWIMGQEAPMALSTCIGSFTFGWLVILFEYRVVINKINGLDHEAAATVLKKNGMKVPRWLNIAAYSCLLSVLMALLLATVIRVL